MAAQRAENSHSPAPPDHLHLEFAFERPNHRRSLSDPAALTRARSPAGLSIVAPPTSFTPPRVARSPLPSTAASSKDVLQQPRDGRPYALPHPIRRNFSSRPPPSTAQTRDVLPLSPRRPTGRPSTAPGALLNVEGEDNSRASVNAQAEMVPRLFSSSSTDAHGPGASGGAVIPSESLAMSSEGTPGAANANAFSSPAQCTSSSSMGGGVHGRPSVASSSGGSADFMKHARQQSYASRRSSSFGNLAGKSLPLVDVKKLLSKPANTTVPQSGSDQAEANPVLSPPPTPIPLPASPPPVQQPIPRPAPTPQQKPSLPQPQRSRESRPARPSTSASHVVESNVFRARSHVPKRPSTSASAYGEQKQSSSNVGYDAIGASPAAIAGRRSRFFGADRDDRLRQSSLSPENSTRESPPAKKPGLSSGMTPAAAIAMAYRVKTAMPDALHPPADLRVSPWDDGKEAPSPDSDGGEFCSPKGLRSVTHKLSGKFRKGSRPTTSEPEVPAQKLIGIRSASFSVDRPPVKPEQPRNVSMDVLQPRVPITRHPSAHKQEPIVRPETRKSASPAVGDPAPSRNHKRRPSTGEQIWSLVRKLSSGNLRAPRRPSSPPPPVPSLSPDLQPQMTTSKRQQSFDTQKSKASIQPPVPPIPIRFTRGSPQSSHMSSRDMISKFPRPSSRATSTSSLHRGSGSITDASHPAKGSPPLHALFTSSPPLDQKDHVQQSRTKSAPNISSTTPDKSRQIISASFSSPQTPIMTHDDPEKDQAAVPARAPRTPRTPPVSFPRTASLEEQLSPRPPLSKTNSRERARGLSITVVDKDNTLMLPIAAQYIATQSRSPSPALTVDIPRDVPVSTKSHDLSYLSPSSVPARGMVVPPPRSASMPTGTTTSAQSPYSATAFSFREIGQSPNGPPLSEARKAELWEDLLKKSEEAGGTLRPRLKVDPVDS